MLSIRMTVGMWGAMRMLELGAIISNVYELFISFNSVLLSKTGLIFIDWDSGITSPFTSHFQCPPQVICNHQPSTIIMNAKQSYLSGHVSYSLISTTMFASAH